MKNESSFTEKISKILVQEPNQSLLNGLLKSLIDSIPSNISIWESGKILYANPAFYNALGIKNGDLEELNKLVETEGYFSIHPDDFDDSEENTESLKNEIQSGVVFHKELRMKSRFESDYRWYNTYVLKSTDPESKVIIEIDEDIHDKKMAAEELKMALAEKEILLKENELLLKEVHHRVKNNFQVIASLLRLQSVKSANDEVKKVLDESRARVLSISKIHERLYKTNSIKLVDICNNIKDITHSLVDVYDGNTKLVKFIYDCRDILLPIDKAIPCMLIINEIVSNALKHAFDDYKKAEIRIEFKEEPDKSIYLSVSDNGRGYPDGYAEKADSIGLMIVNTFAKQLDGKVIFSNENGAKFTISFEQ